MEIFLVLIVVGVLYLIANIRLQSSGNVFRDMIDERKRKEEKYQAQNRDPYDWNNGSSQYQKVFGTKTETPIKELESSLRRAEKEKLKREEEQRKIRIREEARQEDIDAAKRKEEEKKKETPEERKARLKKLAKERVKNLINTPQSFGQNQCDTTGKSQGENNGWLDNIPRDDIKTGPRGGRYRITDKGRKCYDVE